MLAALYPTKKTLKDAKGDSLKYEETSCFKPEYKDDGTFDVVGPSPTSRKWYASVTMADGKIVSVT